MSRIDSGTILVAFFAILFGLVGAFLLRKSLQSRNVVQQPAPVVRSGPTKITVPLASRNLESGTQITIDDVALFRLTRDEMKEHGIKRVFMSNPDQIIGKTVSVDLKRGATFDTKDFYAPGTGPGIASKLDPGQRAVTVEIDATSALLGFAGAGQNVDVLFHYGKDSRSVNPSGDIYDMANGINGAADFSDSWRPPHMDYNPPQSYNGSGSNYANDYERQNRWRSGIGKKYQSATVTLVQKATILALGQRVNQTNNSSRLGPVERVRVTLAVDPESAELIRVAEGHGELSLTLRGEGDEQIVDLAQPKVLSNIIDMENAILIARPEVREIEMFRGQSRSRVRFSRDRDTGKDDFQSWVVAQPAASLDPENNSKQGGSEQISEGPSDSKIDASKRRFSSRRQSNRSATRLSEDQRWSAQQRLQSDFRKIRTLFNQNPEVPEREDDNVPVNVEKRGPNQSDDLSSSGVVGQPRSAKAVELYNPRSWK